MAYTPHNRDFRTWKRYRGGAASDIWLFDLESHDAHAITDWEGTDTIPMWHGTDVYYLSDAGDDNRLNIWRYDTVRREREQVTELTDYDVKWPSIGPGPGGEGEIVFQYGNGLRLLDLATREISAVAVSIPGDRPTLRDRRIDVARQIQGATLAPGGKRVAVEARGDIWTLPAEHGSPRNLTRTSGVAERDPAWSPDGRWIAYFSDASGEYELMVTQSDGRGETRRLTSDGSVYRYSPQWSPDSKHIIHSDMTGRVYLHTVESGETVEVTWDPTAFTSGPTVNWSSDSRWLTYAKGSLESDMTSIYVYDVENATEHQVTSDMFNDGSPTFDRAGDWLYFTSSRVFSPTYSSIDNTFIYEDSGVLLAVPLRSDVDRVWAPKSDEVTWTEDDAAEESGAADEENGDADNGEAAPDEGGADDTAADDGVSGTWTGTIESDQFPPGMEFTLTLTLGADGVLTGTIMIEIGSASLEGVYDGVTGNAVGQIITEEGQAMDFTGTISEGSMRLVVSGGGVEAVITGTRQAAAAASGDEDEDGAEAEDDDEASKSSDDTPIEIEFDGFERRAIQLPVAPGGFASLAVNDKNQLLYVRMGDGIKLFDLKDDKRAEKDVASGGPFTLSADGKKLMTGGRAPMVGNAAAGSTPKRVVTTGMIAIVDPREEWHQLFTDSWRIFRDMFYARNMHGVDWKGVYDRYEPMLADCASRADVDFVIDELISELNTGHTYFGGGDLESGPTVNVGLLGADYEFVNGAYRIKRIVEGGVYDSDARGPLSQPGVDVHEGDYLLAVDGIPLDGEHEPWAAFQGMAGRVVELTVSAAPEMGEEARRVRVKTMGSEGGLRYRHWVESKRRYVSEKTNGAVGYIHVPDTGFNGQNNLFRQFYGQMNAKALIVDERWNGGGQFPNRFIELLSRPTTNYWYRRNGKDWRTPAFSHQGPKCMLINGPAGSGGDMFPYLFKQQGVGKLIGWRTWGGLIGIGGEPRLIDGGAPRVPSYAFYELDGTWGVEGHGVDPDIEVVDDPAKMVDGGDPQLDVAIELMLEEVERNPPTRPASPELPVRSGIGIEEADK
ncbi:MAG: S41 family peptidase [Planctomycetota bacterium]|jgi:tricorn protease